MCKIYPLLVQRQSDDGTEVIRGDSASLQSEAEDGSCMYIAGTRSGPPKHNYLVLYYLGPPHRLLTSAPQRVTQRRDATFDVDSKLVCLTIQLIDAPVPTKWL